MRQTFVPVLLLMAVAMSASKLLPLLSTDQMRLQLLGIEGQQNDNTYTNSYRNRNGDLLRNIFYNMPVNTFVYDQQDDDPQLSYLNADNNQVEHDYNINNKKGSSNEEGFRKEQWHNYPRQLDRLHKYRSESQHADPRILDPGDIEDDERGAATKQYVFEGLSNSIQVNPKYENDYDDKIVNANPLWNLKLRSAHMNEKPNTQKVKLSDITSEEQGNQILNYPFSNAMDIVKNKRTETLENNYITDDTGEENKAITKRIFSLWSRVQGMSHKGHEILQRRRHMHTFYGMPDEGGRTLTAETRAMLMRPPGSPLRWG